VHKCVVPPDHLRSEIKYSRTCHIPNFKSYVYCIDQGSQTRGPHVACEKLLCGPRCFLGILNNQHLRCQVPWKKMPQYNWIKGDDTQCGFRPGRIAPVAILRGGLGKPCPPRFLLVPLWPPQFFLVFRLISFGWHIHGCQMRSVKIPAILSTAPDLSCVVIRQQHRENRDNQYC